MTANATDVVTVAQLKDYDANRASGGGITIDDVYPVGSIYMSVASTSPETLFGGTWTRIQDVFLMCGGSSYTPGSRGGSADLVVPSHTHSASTGSAGSHNHDLSESGVDSLCGITSFEKPTAVATNPEKPFFYVTYTDTEIAGEHTHTVTVSSAGESGTGANIPPYLSVYCWRRVS